MMIHPPSHQVPNSNSFPFPNSPSHELQLHPSTSMEAPTPPPPISAANHHLEPADYSSPRSGRTNSWNDDVPQQQNLRLMCSYGGHIIPRPHDRSLCYVGGDTRIIVIDRSTTRGELHRRLSKTLKLENQQFALKYQIPNEDLDSLISVSTDEDLENMVEEYDRLSNKPGRIRLFLFPRSNSNIEQLLVESASTKSEDWFLNALNGKPNHLSNGGVSDRGFSETSSVNCLLGLDVETPIESKSGGNGNVNVNGNLNSVVTNQEQQSVPDSPMLENSSSFGSTSSSPTVPNLRPIKVHVEENNTKDQFQQINVNSSPLKKQEEVSGYAPAAGTVVSGLPVVAGGGGEYANRVFSDDERSDHSGCRKTQQLQQPIQLQIQPQQITQFQQKQVDLPSPDSASSEGSITNPSRQRQPIYQEPITQQIQSGNYRPMPNPADLMTWDQNKVHMQPQVQEPGYQNHPQFHHQSQQFVHAGTQYIPANTVPVASYYPVYPPQQQQQQHHPHQPDHDQPPYPYYFVPARSAQGYNYTEMATQASSNRPQNQPRNGPPSKPEMPTGVYRTAAPQQYVNFAQIHHPSQSMAQSQAPNSNYTYEFSDPTNGQMYYTQAMPPPQYNAPAQEDSAQLEKR